MTASASTNRVCLRRPIFIEHLDRLKAPLRTTTIAATDRSLSSIFYDNHPCYKKVTPRSIKLLYRFAYFSNIGNKTFVGQKLKPNRTTRSGLESLILLIHFWHSPYGFIINTKHLKVLRISIVQFERAIIPFSYPGGSSHF
jgi:hypothetical protein